MDSELEGTLGIFRVEKFESELIAWAQNSHRVGRETHLHQLNRKQGLETIVTDVFLPPALSGAPGVPSRAVQPLIDYATLCNN